MEIIIIIVIVLLALGFLGSLRLNLYFARKINDVNAREKGLDEVEEGYQADIMDLEDRIDNVMGSFHRMSQRALQERTDLRNKLLESEEKVVEKTAIIEGLRLNILEDGQLIAYLREQLTEAQQTALDIWLENRRLEAQTEWEKKLATLPEN
jgi:hypothetical protein